jgi:hypothetical protein
MEAVSEEGQRRLEDAFAKRIRRRTSFGDFAEGYIGALKQEGRLLPNLLDGVDPDEVLEWVAEQGLPD